MILPKLPKKDPRPVPITVRLSKKSAEQLRNLAKDHNMSQADVIEHLLMGAYSEFQKNKSKKPE